MRIELKRPYPAVETGGELSCGGSQSWFPDENFRRCGCGVVACADTLLYLTGQDRLTIDEYKRYVDSLRRYFPLIPRRGIDGVRLAMGMNACLKRGGVPAGAGWSLSGGRFWDRLAAMLADDLPAIAAVGPNFPRVWDKERLPLYSDGPEGERVEAERIRSHFLTVLALDDDWMEVSSWGRRLFIARADYDRYMRGHGAAFTNLLYLRRK